jgi:hypothetical protein
MNLEQLKKAADDARAAYCAHKPDGTVAGDMESEALLEDAVNSSMVYKAALRAMAKTMRWPADFTNKHGEYGE